MKNLLLFLTAFILTALHIEAGEIVTVWEKEWDINPYGHTYHLDIEFLKGENQFIMMGADGDIGTVEIREALTGELIDSILINNIYEESRFEILPDNKYSGRTIFTDDEKILFLNFGSPLLFFNMQTRSLEYSQNLEFKDKIGLLSKYNKKNKTYIVQSAKGIKSFQFLTQTNIESNKFNNFNLSPNPANNDMTITFDAIAGSAYELSIVDLIGTEIETIKNGVLDSEQFSQDYNISQLPVGVYFIRLDLDGEVVTRKFIKQ